jgi:N-acetylmuramoyl-L-alanine amidase
MAKSSIPGDQDTLIRTVWGEARNQGPDGQRAVAHTILNRANDPGNRYGATVDEVCRRPEQYACWNAGDVNRKPMIALKETDSEYKTIQKNLSPVLNGTDTDNTNQSKHYHTSTTKDEHPWANEKDPTVKIGDHWFYDKIDD